MIPRKNLLRALKKSVYQPRYAFDNLFRRLKAALFYRLYDGKSTWPETISFFLTYICNLRCAMCGQWGEAGAFNEYSGEVLRQRLAVAEFAKIIEDIKGFKPNITLFGGEPMLHPQWLEIVCLVKQAGLRCNIVTNGTLIKKNAAEIIASGLDEIIFSLDGPEEIHDRIRRVPGTFKLSIEGFQQLNELKKQNRSKKPIININCTLWEDNYRYIDDTIKVAELIEAEGLTFHHLLFLSKPTVRDFLHFFETRFKQNPSDWIGFARDDAPAMDIDFLLEKIKMVNSGRYRTNVSFYPNFNESEVRQWYSKFEFESTSYKNRCLSLWLTAYIFPDGSVRPYHSMNYTLGNIHEESFSRIWNNADYQKYRKYIKDHKRFAVCAKGCTEFFRY
jgi:MoaA/NifB/PqqE/SkfB family radical SAM enzyme